MNHRIVISLFVLYAILSVVQRASAQGPLSPTAGPAPTMKTLSQVEPRIAITSATAVTISSPGSYYLTTNMTVSTSHVISITVSGVTIDLNGFTLSSTAASPSGNGILLASGLSDITILNGHITSGVTYSGGSYSGTGFLGGINYNGTSPFNVRVSGVSVSGVLDSGIFLGGNSTVVDSCTVNTVGSYGIQASSVTHSTAYQCGNTAIDANTASDCYGYGTGSGDGVRANQTATGCFGQSGTGYGLYANTALNCSGVSSNGGGIHTLATAENCYGVSASTSAFSGLYAFSALNCNGLNSGAGDGLDAAQNATGCYGQSVGGNGLSANNAENCSGQSSSGVGLNASQTATGCSGISSNGVGLSANNAENCSGSSYFQIGLQANQTATGCYGSSYGYLGLLANIANNCSGVSTNGFGVEASSIANSCYGYTGLPTVAVVATITIGCYGAGMNGGGGVSAEYYYNEP